MKSSFGQPDDFGRVAYNYAAGGNIGNHNGARTHDRVVSKCDVSDN
jgi:hypothetical protein